MIEFMMVIHFQGALQDQCDDIVLGKSGAKTNVEA